MLKKFVERKVFKLIQENIIFLSKGICFANRYKFSHEEIEVFPKDKKFGEKK
jgi:hypothetical protein